MILRELGDAGPGSCRGTSLEVRGEGGASGTATDCVGKPELQKAKASGLTAKTNNAARPQLQRNREHGEPRRLAKMKSGDVERKSYGRLA